MTIGELDGYVTALIVSSEVILPSEWLPGAWGGEDAFGNLAEVEELVAAVMAHYNRIARQLAEDPGSYAPVLEVDPNGGDLMWGPWINGFERAMRLRADAWEQQKQDQQEEEQKRKQERRQTMTRDRGGLSM